MMTLLCYAPGAGGAPSTANQLLPIIWRSYEHTINAIGGFESCRVTMPWTDELFDYWCNYLMASCGVYDQNADKSWEGALTKVTARIGQETRSLSLDGVFNRVKGRYTTVLSTPGVTATVSNTASQNQYGVRDGIVSVGKTTGAAAVNEATRYLGERAYPIMQPETEIATGELGDMEMSLEFTGWYFLLDTLLTANTSTTNTTTTTQVQTLTTAFVAVNAFLSTTYSDIVSSGITDTEYIEPDTTYRTKIEAMLKKGNSSNERLAWGVYEDRKWRIGQWAGATPTAITYQRYISDGRVYDVMNNIVSPSRVRPDAMYQVISLLDPNPVSAAQDAVARFYVERVSLSISADSVRVTLEPQMFSSVDATIARLQ